MINYLRKFLPSLTISCMYKNYTSREIIISSTMSLTFIGYLIYYNYAIDSTFCQELFKNINVVFRKYISTKYISTTFTHLYSNWFCVKKN